MSSSAKPKEMTPKSPPATGVVGLARDILNGQHQLSKTIPVLLWVFDAVLCGLIILKVPYTEIDWVAYMEQVKQFLDGERDYTLIKGGTGPLVYPAAHVYTYSVLYYITDEGRNIFRAQQIFAVLYMATLGLVMACYWRAKVPPYIFPLLVLSKRLHSVFILRCFNDCVATFFLWLAIYFFQRRSWTFGSAAYSWGLGIKMSMLLVLPAIAVVLFLGRGFHGAIRLAWLMAQVQIVIAVPFCVTNTRAYLGRAFELTRTFKYEWTVNMRMLPEDVFLSSNLSMWLLIAHALDLFAFLSERWLAPTKKHIIQVFPPLLQWKSPFTPREELLTSLRTSPRYILATILTANNIGLLFARSLHYQFYAYLAWSTPFLLWHAGVHPVLIYVVWGVQEWAWNVFPSTKASSLVVVFALAFTDRALWMGKRQEVVDEEEDEAYASSAQSVRAGEEKKTK